jgi:hypothetical protein
MLEVEVVVLEIHLHQQELLELVVEELVVQIMLMALMEL